jgi:hypothetical protein
MRLPIDGITRIILVMKPAQHSEVLSNPGATQFERLLDEYEYAQIINRSIGSVRRDRLLGKGCQFVKVGALVRYRPSDVTAYIASNVRRAT